MDSGETTSYEVATNDVWYQHIVNLSPNFVLRHPELLDGQPIEWNSYNLPYRFSSSPKSVLVLGAGTGNDVAAALRNGAHHVTAVEIDPLILELGRRLHFERPYDSPRVSVVIDDARSYWTRPPYEGARWIAPHHDGERFYAGYWEGNRGRVEHEHHWDHDRDRDFHEHGRHGDHDQGNQGQDER